MATGKANKGASRKVAHKATKKGGDWGEVVCNITLPFETAAKLYWLCEQHGLGFPDGIPDLVEKTTPPAKPFSCPKKGGRTRNVR